MMDISVHTLTLPIDLDLNTFLMPFFALSLSLSPNLFVVVEWNGMKNTAGEPK